MKYAEFFKEVEDLRTGVPSYVALVDHFSADGLRRHRVPMEWLTARFDLMIDPDAKERSSEQRRIEALLASLPGSSVGGRALASYWRNLSEKVVKGHILLKSARLALRPAVTLLTRAHPMGEALPDQKTLSAVLSESPGQRAALHGFVGFLRKDFELELDMQGKVAQPAAAADRRLLKLVQQLPSPESHAYAKFAAKWIVECLVRFHGLSRPAATKVSNQPIHLTADGIRLQVDGRECWIPTWSSLSPAADASKRTSETQSAPNAGTARQPAMVRAK